MVLLVALAGLCVVACALGGALGFRGRAWGVAVGPAVAGGTWLLGWLMAAASPDDGRPGSPLLDLTVVTLLVAVVSTVGFLCGAVVGLAYRAMRRRRPRSAAFP